jgi:hypothetical protein
MSSTSGTPIDLQAILAKLDRDRAETQKLQEETRKFVSEQHKLMAEGNKFNRDRWILPLTVLLTVAGSIVVGVIISLPTYLHMFGWVKP